MTYDMYGFGNTGLVQNGSAYTNLGSTFYNAPAVQTFGNIAPGSAYAVNQNVSYGNPAPPYSGFYAPSYPTIAPGGCYYPSPSPHYPPQQNDVSASLLRMLQFMLMKFMKNGAYTGPGFDGGQCRPEPGCRDCPVEIIEEQIIRECPKPSPTPTPDPREHLQFVGGRTLNFTGKDIYVRDDKGADHYEIQGDDNSILIDNDKNQNTYRVGGTNNDVIIRDIGRDDHVTLSGNVDDWAEVEQGSDNTGHYISFVNNVTGTATVVYTDHREWTHEQLRAHISVGDYLAVPQENSVSSENE